MAKAKDNKDQRIKQIQNQMTALQEKLGEIEEEELVKIKWYPQRSHSKNNQVRLSDGSFIVGLPETVLDEADAQARVVLAMLGEILTLREQLAAIQNHIGSTNRQPMSPVPELKDEAVAFKDGVVNQTIVDNAKAEQPNT